MREQKSFYTASSSSNWERQLHFIGIRYPWHKEPKARDTSMRDPHRQDARCIFQCFSLSTLFACQPCEKLYFCAVGLCVPPKFNYFRFSDLFGTEIEKNGKLFKYAPPNPVANIPLSISCRSAHKWINFIGKNCGDVRCIFLNLKEWFFSVIFNKM